MKLIDQDIAEILITNEQIINKCQEIGKIISLEYQNKKPLLIGLLKGAVPFLAELIKHITCPIEIAFLSASSYQGSSSTGNVKIGLDVEDVINRHLIFIEDIIDTGLTLNKIMEIFKIREPASMEIIALLDKLEGRRITQIKPKYIGFNIPNKFVVGFGLDYNELYRNLPYIGILKKEIYQMKN